MSNIHIARVSVDQFKFLKGVGADCLVTIHFADQFTTGQRRAIARRWVNRQAGLSFVKVQRKAKAANAMTGVYIARSAC